MRLTDAERHPRLCSAIVEVLVGNGSWLSREQIRVGMGQGWVHPDELEAALTEVQDQGLILAKKRRKGVGRHGRPRTVYAARTARLVLHDGARDPVRMEPVIAIDPAARTALMEYAATRFQAARADATASLEEEAMWRTALLALSGDGDHVRDREDATPGALTDEGCAAP